MEDSRCETEVFKDDGDWNLRMTCKLDEEERAEILRAGRERIKNKIQRR